MTVHFAPSIVPCCRMDIEQLAEDDQISDDPQHVTCRMQEETGVAEYLALTIIRRKPGYSNKHIGELVGLSAEHVKQLRT